MKLCFATNNQHKLAEVSELLGPSFRLVSLQDIGCNQEIPEDHDTLEENSQQKARFIHTRYKINTFADDTGLEVDALNGEPGVYSARYAGPDKDDKKNVKLLLEKLNGETNRSAQFRTVISLILDDKNYQFEGIVRGKITTSIRGQAGFGYDPVFVPDGHKHTFAEMSMQEKGAISHRGRAIAKLVIFLKEAISK